MLGSILLMLFGVQPPADLDSALEASTKAALARIAPSVVQVRTVGGAEFVGKRETVQRGVGPTTGLIAICPRLSPDPEKTLRLERAHRFVPSQG